MNQRIREIAEQAGIKLPDDSAYNGHIYRNSIEQFAKLIVRECADQFRLVYTDEQYQRRIDKTILKHFGLYE